MNLARHRGTAGVLGQRDHSARGLKRMLIAGLCSVYTPHPCHCLCSHKRNFKMLTLWRIKKINLKRGEKKACLGHKSEKHFYEIFLCHQLPSNYYLLFHDEWEM